MCCALGAHCCAPTQRDCNSMAEAPEYATGNAICAPQTLYGYRLRYQWERSTEFWQLKP